MSLNLVIERPQNPITQTEWEAWLHATPGFEVTDKIRGTNPRTGRPINISSESTGLWTRSGGRPDGYFQFHAGVIVPIDPDNGMITKARDIALALGARVVER